MIKTELLDKIKYPSDLRKIEKNKKIIEKIPKNWEFIIILLMENLLQIFNCEIRILLLSQ